jgi:hypothetical protein
MIEFIIILLVSIGLSVSEAGSTVLGGQVYDEVGECHTAGTRVFRTIYFHSFYFSVLVVISL